MPAPPWTPEHAVTEDLARALIENQFPELRPVELHIIGVGWDNTALLVNGRFVFRFPRRSVAVPLLETEIRVLPQIAARLPLPIPVPVFVGRRDSRYPWPYAGYERLAGQTACSAGLSDVERSDLAEPLAEFLSALHTIQPAEAHVRGAPRDTWNRFDMKRKVPLVRQRLTELAATGLIPDAAPYLELVDQAPTLRRSMPLSLTHGDLYVRHLLLARDTGLSGVIDWGDVHIGDIAIDLAIVWTLLPPDGRERFRLAYRHTHTDGETWRLARFQAVYHASVTTYYAHQTGDLDLTREGLLALRSVLC